MASSIPVMWPKDDINVNVVSPSAILRAQTEPLSVMTHGLLEAEVTTTTTDWGDVSHHLDLIAPVLNGYRYRLLSATHDAKLFYPVKVAALCFQPDKSEASSLLPRRSEEKDWRPIAATEQEFIQLLGKVLHSNQVKSIIQSLIARSNEQRSDPDILAESSDESEPDAGDESERPSRLRTAE